MIRFGILRSVAIVALLDAVCMYSLNHALNSSPPPRSRMLLLQCTYGDYWQRTIDGANDAAQALGIDLAVKWSTPAELLKQQFPQTQNNVTDLYDGVALASVDARLELDSINALADRMNVVTLDREDCDSKRACHVGYAQFSSGQLAANIVHDHFSHPGKIVLLATTFSDKERNRNVKDRLAGFKEQWQRERQKATPCTLEAVVAGPDFAAVLNDPAVVFLVALDAPAAEFAIQAMAAQSPTRHMATIAFDPNKEIFDAIENGHLDIAIFDDPYHKGYAAVELLRHYREIGKFAMPVPGQGTFFLHSEVVTKANIAQIRRRLES